MAKRQLPPDQTVARYVPARLLITDRSDRSIAVGCFPDAFKLRKTVNETYLSCGWLECFPGTQQQQVDAVAAAMRSKKFDLKAGSGFAVGVVGDIASCCSGAIVVAVHAPAKLRPDYTQVWGIPEENNAVLVALGTTAWGKIVRAG